MNALLQILAGLVMFFVTLLAGLVPMKLVAKLKKSEENSPKGSKWLSMLSCFSGGIFMGTCFLDIIPHINENYERFKTETGREFAFAWPQFGICVGFLLVYFLEELFMRVFKRPHLGHSHGDVPTELENNNHEQEVQRKESLNLRNTEALLGTELCKDQRTLSIHSLVLEETAAYAVAPASETSFLKSLTFAIAMSFHSILEGFALGVQDTPTRIITLFISLILHKGIEAFSVGLQIVKGAPDKKYHVICTILVYALMTPLGSALGTFLQMSGLDPIIKDGFVLLFESLAAGTFIYVTFLEVLAPEKHNLHNSLKQLFAITLGFVLIAILQFAFGGHGHGGHEEGGHSHEHPMEAVEAVVGHVLANITGN